MVLPNWKIGNIKRDALVKRFVSMKESNLKQYTKSQQEVVEILNPDCENTSKLLIPPVSGQNFQHWNWYGSCKNHGNNWYCGNDFLY